MTVLCVNSTVVYADIAAAEAAEAGTDYGVPTRFEQAGTSTAAVSFAGANFVSSAIYVATSGEEANGDIAVGAGTTSTINSTVDGMQILDVRTNRLILSSCPNAFIRRLVVDGGGGDSVSYNDTIDAEDILCYNCDDGFLASVARPNSSLVKCTVVGAGRFGYASGKFNDCVDVDSANQGFFNEQVGSTGTWENDGTGTDSITESTATDIFENYAGGDYRIKATSSPGVAGAGAFINAGTGSSITVTGTTPNYSLSAISASIDLTGSIDVVGATPNYSLSAISAAIDLTGEISIIGQTPNYNLLALVATVDLTGEISVTGQTVNYAYAANQAIVDLTGEIIVNGQTPNYSVDSISAVIDLTSLISVVGQTPNYNYSALQGSVDLAGEILVTGQTVNYGYTALSGLITIGEGQTIGTVTASFKDSNITSSFKNNDITVQYTVSNITVNFKE